MINESQLTTMFNSVQSDHKSLENALAAMNRELSALDAKREQYHPDFFAKKQSEIRDKFMPAIKATREKIRDTSATMQTAAVFYESPAFYLSMQPLTSPVNGKIDQGTESIARLAKSTELSKMAPAMLELCAESAKQRGAWGELGMILVEAGSRDERISIPLDNPFIDQEEYRSQIEASCPTDPELLRAWLEGDWAIARGAFFSSVIEEKRNAVEPWQEKPAKRGWDDWEYYLAHDFGVSAPSVTYVVAKSPGVEGPDGRYYPKDSLVLIDELATNEPGSLSKGMGYTVSMLSEEIKDMCHEWKIKPDGVADDACFSKQGYSAGSISDEFRKNGVYLYPAKKGDRRTGWEIMRRMLQDAGKPDKPGLYVARNCEYFWSTVPYLARDPRKADDLDTRGPDHAADACRYGLMRQKNTVTSYSAW